MRHSNFIDATCNIFTKPLIVPYVFERIGLILIFTIFTALGAFIYIPLGFTPVPVTLQTFFVLLAGLKLKTTDAVFSQLLYIILGGLGVPIFAGLRSGFFGVTSGYLWGFVLAVWFLSFLNKTKKSFINTCIILILANLIILVLGALWLGFSLNLGIVSSINMGILPFIPGDLVKILILLSVYKFSFNRYK